MSRSEGREVEEEQERRKWRRERGSRRSHRTPDAHKDAARNTLAYYRYIRGLLQVGKAGEKGTWRVSFLLPLSNFMLLIFVSSEIWLFLFNCRLLRFLFYRCSGLFTILLFCFTLFALNCAAFLWLFTYNYLFNFFCLTHVFFYFFVSSAGCWIFYEPTITSTHSLQHDVFFPVAYFSSFVVWLGKTSVNRRRRVHWWKSRPTLNYPWHQFCPLPASLPPSTPLPA